VIVGHRPPGPLNAITDVTGVRVGQRTVARDPSNEAGAVRTGVTTIFPHDGLAWKEPVYVGTHVLNGYGEMIGINQMNEWGVLHSPVVLTSSLAIGKAYDATARWIAGLDPETAGDEGFMPVVSECDDSFLNDALSFPLADEDVWAALDAATGGPVEEGCVGSGAGMACFDFKGGIGTASRVLGAPEGGYTVGALVMTNYGDREELRIDGIRVGAELTDLMPEEHSEGSCVVVVATDAPMLPHQLRRVAQRGAMGLARTGSTAHNGSGELMLAFSTANRMSGGSPDAIAEVRAVADGQWGDAPPVQSEVFAATIEAVEEAVVNALFAATTTVGHEGHVLHALPIERTLEILQRHGALTR
jgi:D-aminopeptidase